MPTRREFLATTGALALLPLVSLPGAQPDPNDRTIERLEFTGFYTQAFDHGKGVLHMRTRDPYLTAKWCALEGGMAQLEPGDVFRMRDGGLEAPIADLGHESEICIVQELPYQLPSGVWAVNAYPVKRIAVFLFQPAPSGSSATLAHNWDQVAIRELMRV